MFGVDLEYLLRREVGGQTPPPGTVPSIIERCLMEVETRGLNEVGICKYWNSIFPDCTDRSVIDRIAGANSEINALKDAFNRGRSRIFKHFLDKADVLQARFP